MRIVLWNFDISVFFRVLFFRYLGTLLFGYLGISMKNNWVFWYFWNEGADVL